MSPICAKFSSRMQQLSPYAFVRHRKVEATDIQLLKRLGTLSTISMIPAINDDSLSVADLSDAGRASDHGKLCFGTDILVGGVKRGSIYHVISWSSHLGRFHVRPIATAEVLICGESIEEGKVIAANNPDLHSMRIPLHILLYSKDSFFRLSSQRQHVDRNVYPDVNVIFYDYEFQNLTYISWLPGRVNLADPGTKVYISLIDALQLILADVRLFTDHYALGTSSSHHPLS